MNVQEAYDLAYTIGPDHALVLADELVQVNAELAAVRDQLAELNEVLADAFPQIDAVIHDHPAAHLRAVD